MSCSGCHQSNKQIRIPQRFKETGEKVIRVALIGNPNVGKSVIFNQLTGAHQIIGNWPGKTVEIMTGRLRFDEKLYEIIDLPGVYSLSVESGESKGVEEFLLSQNIDFIINIVDSTLLERNLALTVELLSLDMPMVLSLNIMDRAERQGVKIDTKALSEELEIPVISTSGLKGIGITDLLRAGTEEIRKHQQNRRKVNHTAPVAKAIGSIRDTLLPATKEPAIWLSERLLIGDETIEKRIAPENPNAVRISRENREILEKQMDDQISSIVASDHYAVSAGITSRVIDRSSESIMTFEEKIHGFLTHRVYGILALAGIALSAFIALFLVGDFFATIMIDWFNGLHPDFILLFSDPKIGEFIWSGVLGGVISVISIVLPYLIPFFILLAVLEDSGYLSRAAFVMDNILHRIGLHGKAFFPMLLGYSCNVPACLGCRILETERERVLAIFAVTLIPCAATSIVILGLVGTYVGLAWVVLLFAFNLFLVAVLTRVAYSILPGEPTALIMEMPPMRMPSLKLTFRQTWTRIKDFIYIAVPLLIALGIVLGLLQYFGLLDVISDAISPLTVWWLGLPAFAGILLIFGIMRKELTLLLLGTVAGTTAFNTVMTDTQMIVFTLVVMLYIPCIATIGALIKEIGMKRAMIITFFEIGFAILVGGIAFRLLSL